MPLCNILANTTVILGLLTNHYLGDVPQQCHLLVRARSKLTIEPIAIVINLQFYRIKHKTHSITNLLTYLPSYLIPTDTCILTHLHFLHISKTHLLTNLPEVLLISHSYRTLSLWNVQC